MTRSPDLIADIARTAIQAGAAALFVASFWNIALNIIGA